MMDAIKIAQTLAIGYATFWAVYLMLLLLIASVWKTKTTTRAGVTYDTRCPTFAVLIPARNMSQTITPCIRSVQACDASEQATIYVIADHCTDDTAACAQAAGATVLTRQNGPQGKTYTLAWALDELSARGGAPDLYVIVDATAQVEPRFLAALADCWQQGEDIITSRAIVNLANHKWYARCLGLMLVHRNVQRWCRERLGLSALLGGRGMAYSRAYIQRFGWRLALPTGLRASHPTEDWRHAVRAAEQGYRVAFAEDAVVVTPLRSSLAEATKQGARWERGRLINALTHALRLLLQGLRQRNLVKICAALDAMQPPVVILGAVAFTVAVLSAVAFGPSLRGIISLVPVLLVSIYGVIIVARGHREGLHYTTLLWAPCFVVWRCVSFVLAWGFLDRFNLGKARKDSVGKPA